MIECKFCETLYDEKEHPICPRCEQKRIFDDGPWRYNNKENK